jgi:hypothetical protein
MAACRRSPPGAVVRAQSHANGCATDGPSERVQAVADVGRVIATMHDPNWFYSTLAQSTAAIVGLAGGFMVNRVVQQRNEVAPERERARGIFEMLCSELEIWRANAQDVANRMSKLVPRLEKHFEETDETFPVATQELSSFSHPGNWSPSGPSIPADCR